MREPFLQITYVGREVFLTARMVGTRGLVAGVTHGLVPLRFTAPLQWGGDGY